MTTLLLLALLALQTDPVVINFDATKAGELPPEIESVDKSRPWIVSSDSGDPSGNHFLTSGGSIDELTRSAIKAAVPADFVVTFRMQLKKVPSAQVDSVSGIDLELEEGKTTSLIFDLKSQRLTASAIPHRDGGPHQIRLIETAALPQIDDCKWATVELKVRDCCLLNCSINDVKLINSDRLRRSPKGAFVPKIGFFSAGNIFRIDDITIKPLPPELSQILQIRGMTCELCEAKVEAALKAVKGVKDAKASHKEGSCTVTLDENAPPDIKDLIKAVEDAHYHATTEGA